MFYRHKLKQLHHRYPNLQKRFFINSSHPPHHFLLLLLCEKDKAVKQYQIKKPPIYWRLYGDNKIVYILFNYRVFFTMNTIYLPFHFPLKAQNSDYEDNDYITNYP